MIKSTGYIKGQGTDPYENLALEECLITCCGENECILYLWQNEHTVVIGRNQNAWEECKVDLLREEGGYLARRLSGGGAVYHDLGNLNFTFLARKENYDQRQQLDVILRAVRSLGVPAEASGRNDILAEGRKFSGNAFYEQDGCCCHHGTLMVDVDIDKLDRYLTVSEQKPSSEGVNSVPSRVVNLTEFVPGLTIVEVEKALMDAFAQVYQISPVSLKIKDLDADKLASEKRRMASWDWIYGKSMDFQYEMEHKFDWGTLQLQFALSDGCVRDLAVYTDALFSEPVETLTKVLTGCRFEKSELAGQLRLFASQYTQGKAMLNDVADWFMTHDW